jgi:hypothetical protein
MDIEHVLMKQMELEDEDIEEDREPLLAHMEYPETARMALHLSLQLKILEDHGYTLLFWQKSDISLIKKRIYLLTNLSQLVPLHKNGNDLVLNYPNVFPFPRDACAPELFKMSALPFITHRSASYYSLALLCLKMLNLSLDEIQGTHLFYFLERCLKIEPNARVCLAF